MNLTIIYDTCMFMIGHQLIRILCDLANTIDFVYLSENVYKVTYETNKSMICRLIDEEVHCYNVLD